MGKVAGQGSGEEKVWDRMEGKVMDTVEGEMKERMQ